MILLTSTNDLLNVVTSSTQVINVHCSWVGLNGTTVTPSRQNTVISSATTTPIITSPGVSTQYNVKSIVITNTDASVPETVSVTHTDGTNVVTLITLTLAAGNTLTWTEDEGWAVIANGSNQTSGAAMASVMSDYDPIKDVYDTGIQSQLTVDPTNHLLVRGPVNTDEGSFYDHFAGLSLSTALTGTLTFGGGAISVTGSGTAFTTQVQQGQYVKLSADPETAYAQVDSVQSDTQLTLSSGYTGSSTSGASVVNNWATVTASGATIAVDASYCTITNGTGSGAKTYIYRELDYAPLQAQLFGFVLGLTVGQTGYMGFVDNPASPTQQILFKFGNGLPANQFLLVTSGTGGATDTTTQTCTFPSGLATGVILSFTITFAQNKVVVSMGSPNVMEPVVVASAVQNIPNPYTLLYGVVGFTNNTAITASATIYADGVLITDANRVEVANTFVGDPLSVLLSGKNSAGQIQAVGVDNNNASLVTTSGFEDMTGVVRGSPSVVQLGATVNQNYSLSRVKIALGQVGQDRGDPDPDGGRGLPVEMFAERRLMEQAFLQAYVASLVYLQKRSSESLRTAEALLTGRTGRTGRM